MSPSVSASAFLQSIIPAPVRSRSSLTCAAVIVGVLTSTPRPSSSWSSSSSWGRPSASPRPSAPRPRAPRPSGLASAFGLLGLRGFLGLRGVLGLRAPRPWAPPALRLLGLGASAAGGRLGSAAAGGLGLGGRSGRLGDRSGRLSGRSSGCLRGDRGSGCLRGRGGRLSGGRGVGGAGGRQRGLGLGALAGLGLGALLLLGLAAGLLLGLAAGLLLGLLARLLLLGAEDLAALGDHVADRLRDQRAGADRVVVARDDEVDAVRVAVGVDEADDRDPQALGLADGDDLGLEVDHEHRVGRALHVLDAAEVGPELLEVGLGRHPLARRQQLQLALGLVALEVVQAPDALRDGLEVRQQATEPAVVDVRLTGRLGDLLDGVARLLLGADEQHGAAAVGDVAREPLRLLEQGLGLEQVDDVDAAVLAMDEPAHLGVPAASLVAEVHAGLQQLADSYLSHGGAPLGLILVVQPGRSRSRDPARRAGQGPCLGWRRSRRPGFGNGYGLQLSSSR